MRNRKNTRKEAVFFRFYNDLYCYCQSIRPHPRLWEAPSDRQRTDSTGISPIRCPTSLPATFFSRSDCDWTGVPLFSLWVMAKSGAARYFESVKTGSPPFIARCHLAGHGVPLHTLMLITITKRKYLANDYSVVKEQARGVAVMTVFQLGRAAACAPPHPPGLSRRIMSLYYTFHFRGQSCRLSGYFFQKFFQTPQTGIDRAGDSALMSAFRFCNFRLAHTEKKVCVNPVPLFFRQRGKRLI